MGAGASAGGPSPPVLAFPLKRLPEQVEEAIFCLERFCLILDPSELAARYLKYQLGSFVASDDVANFNAQYLNRALVGALRYGRTLTIKLPSLDGWALEGPDSIFQPKLFPRELLDRQQFLRPEVWTSVLKPELGDPPAEDICVSSEFVFCLCVTSPGAEVPPELSQIMHVFKITEANGGGGGGGGVGGGEREGDVLDCVAGMLGAAEIVRNSPQLVEAAFDGDIDVVKSWLDKGFHIESCDGRKHTALSEGACQGHASLCVFLIEQGANPNALSDTGRSPLWRASFSGHLETAILLLEAGSNPEYRDSISMESAFDVARTDEIRALLSGWDQQRTEQLMQARKRAVLAKLEERIQTSQQREEFARHKIRCELVAKAEAGDVEGVRDVLLMVADEAEKTGLRPRATAEARADTGQSLLSIAAQHDHVDLAAWLLTHHQTCDKDRWDLVEGQMSVEAKVCKANVNSRDLKGWNCVCIAVFHRSLKVLRLLLEHGGDTSMRSQYNKHAHDLAKDELDAALNVVTDRSEIRAVIQEYDQGAGKGRGIFGTVGPSVLGERDLYHDLHRSLHLQASGSPVVMQLELARDAQAREGGGKGGKGGKAAAGGKQTTTKQEKSAAGKKGPKKSGS